MAKDFFLLILEQQGNPKDFQYFSIKNCFKFIDTSYREYYKKLDERTAKYSKIGQTQLNINNQIRIDNSIK